MTIALRSAAGVKVKGAAFQARRGTNARREYTVTDTTVIADATTSSGIRRGADFELRRMSVAASKAKGDATHKTKSVSSRADSFCRPTQRTSNEDPIAPENRIRLYMTGFSQNRRPSASRLSEGSTWGKFSGSRRALRPVPPEAEALATGAGRGSQAPEPPLNQNRRRKSDPAASASSLSAGLFMRCASRNAATSSDVTVNARSGARCLAGIHRISGFISRI